jgi:hypothetical protein
MFWTWEGAV